MSHRYRRKRRSRQEKRTLYPLTVHCRGRVYCPIYLPRVKQWRWTRIKKQEGFWPFKYNEIEPILGGIAGSPIGPEWETKIAFGMTDADFEEERMKEFREAGRDTQAAMIVAKVVPRNYLSFGP